MLPSLTLQPLVENAVRHGIMRREEGGTVRLMTRETEEGFEVKVQDDEVGFDCHKEPEDSRQHQNVRYRLESMCKGRLQVESIPGRGTTITLSASIANIFTAKGEEQLETVSFYTTDAGTRYEISVYTGVRDGDPTSGKLVYTGHSGTEQ